MKENHTFLIDDWNEELAEVLIPNDVILSMYIIAGVLGNGLVIFLYGFRMKSKKEDRYFIPFLAVTDLIACSVCASFGIALNMMQVKFQNDELCKAWWFFSAMMTYLSILMLLTIAVHRYRKICQPLGPQMTLRWKRLAMVVIFGISVVLAGPTTMFYGTVSFPNEDNSLIGLRCSKIKDENKVGSLVYGIVVVLLICAVIVSLITIYTFIGCTIYRHFKECESYEIKTTQRESKKNNTKPHAQEMSSSGSHFTSEDSCHTDASSDCANGIPTSPNKDNTRRNYTDENSPEENVRDKVSVGDVPEDFSNMKSEVSQSKSVNTGVRVKSRGLHKKTNKRIMHKFTLIYMLITFVFLLSAIPKVILFVIEGLNPKFWEEFSDTERAGVLFIYRMYIINNVANPIIYGFLDAEFKRELKKLCGRK